MTPWGPPLAWPARPATPLSRSICSPSARRPGPVPGPAPLPTAIAPGPRRRRHTTACRAAYQGRPSDARACARNQCTGPVHGHVDGSGTGLVTTTVVDARARTSVVDAALAAGAGHLVDTSVRRAGSAQRAIAPRAPGDRAGDHAGDCALPLPAQLVLHRERHRPDPLLPGSRRDRGGSGRRAQPAASRAGYLAAASPH